MLSGKEGSIPVILTAESNCYLLLDLASNRFADTILSHHEVVVEGVLFLCWFVHAVTFSQNWTADVEKSKSIGEIAPQQRFNFLLNLSSTAGLFSVTANQTINLQKENHKSRS